MLDRFTSSKLDEKSKNSNQFFTKLGKNYKTYKFHSGHDWKDLMVIQITPEKINVVQITTKNQEINDKKNQKKNS